MTTSDVVPGANDTSGTDGASLEAIQAKLFGLQRKYTEEASKRLRSDGLAQYVNLQDAGDARIRSLGKDPWADHAALNAKAPSVKDGGKYKFVILGGGYGGLIAAVRLIEAGLVNSPDDLRIIEAGGGYGGTWYWNRYPGLHCDVESYIYMPLLEETGYTPKHKYSSGLELREHAERIATKWDLHDKALFRSEVTDGRWSDEEEVWNLSVTEDRGPEGQRKMNIQANYFFVMSGVLTIPHVPKVSGLEGFNGSMFHTSRWDYGVTGGSQEDQNLSGLEGKRVGIIGTGATAIQAVPKLAKFAKEVYVFQRTPSSVSWRGQKETDPEEWKTKIATKKGWQKERRHNWDTYLNNCAPPEQENLVGCGWTEAPACCAIIGSPNFGFVQPTPEAIGEHIGKLMMLDVPRAEKARARIDDIVNDPETAAALKPWYPVWCKRPTFSDEYLQAFNLPHVHLVDTDGKGVDSATSAGLVVQGKEYPLDVLVLSTGYRSPGYGGLDPVKRTGINMFGRGGKSFSDKWKAQGASTFHGIISHGFPNFFFSPTGQFGQTPNNVETLDTAVEHMTHFIKKAEEKAGGVAVIDPTTEAEEEWAMEAVKRAANLAALTVCTPGYMTLEGEFNKPNQDPAEMMKNARMGIWSEGILSFSKLLEAYRAGDLGERSIGNIEKHETVPNVKIIIVSIPTAAHVHSVRKQVLRHQSTVLGLIRHKQKLTPVPADNKDQLPMICRRWPTGPTANGMLDLSWFCKPNEYHLGILNTKPMLTFTHRWSEQQRSRERDCWRTKKKNLYEPAVLPSIVSRGRQKAKSQQSLAEPITAQHSPTANKLHLVTSADLRKVIKMKLSSSIFSLTVAGLAAATPVPAHLDVRADAFWYMSGWGNPNCQGSFLWVYQGTGNACVNVRTQAASIDFASTMTVRVELINAATCGIAGRGLLTGPSGSTTDESGSVVQVIEVKGTGDGANGSVIKRAPEQICRNIQAGVQAFRITLL
ncbi:hypothetical protein QBC40DRAFT_295115 [Triangularia verruculosa]|uniref:FAD/NAD(P)-binding domain-containing protein n=1 Tax=Triangularia verruculosa TaxID=2587418 RepID=A0AAN6XJW9_9PEZI|nr:hypothetical protein QBC40DRAFT_295115 [Triangularia verruculosa]